MSANAAPDAGSREPITGAATEGACVDSSTTAFECFAACGAEAFSEVLVLAFLVEGAAFADTTGSEGFNFLKTYSPRIWI